MKIDEVKISGLRSHRGDPPTVVNLAGKSLVAVVGPTGAGKSSLLEAICFALYGEATFGGKAYRELSTDGRSEISVQMTFALGADRYQLVRSVAPNRNGVFGAKATWLRKVDADGNALTHTDQVRKVDAAIRALLGGMDRVQFCQAVLLAQNRFAELLETDERKRHELLDILLGLTALADARKALHTTDRAVQRNEERLMDRRAGFPVDPIATASEAAERAAAMEKLATQAQAGAERLKQLVDEATSISNQVRSIGAAAALAVAGEDGYERLVALVLTLGALVEDEQRLVAHLQAAEQSKDKDEGALERAHRALETAECEHGKAGTHEVVVQQLAELGRLLVDRHGQAAAVEEAQDTLTTLAGQLADAKEEEVSAAAHLTDKEEAAGAAKEAAETARNTLAARQQDVDTVAQLAVQLDALVGGVANGLEQLAVEDAAATSASDALHGLETAWRRAAKDLNEAQRVATAAAAAHGHDPGDPCPVCHRNLPDGWAPPASPDLEEARRCESDAKATYDSAVESHRKAAERRAGCAGAFATAASNVAAKRAELAKMAEDRGLSSPPLVSAPEIPAELPLGVANEVVRELDRARHPLEDWRRGLDELLVPLREAASRAAVKAEKAEGMVTTARRRAQAASRAVGELDAKCAASEQAQKIAASALETTTDRILELQNLIPENWISLVDPDAPGPVETAQKVCLADKEAVDAAVEARNAVSQSLTRNQQRIASLKDEKSKKINEPFATARAELGGLLDVVKALTRVIDMPEPVPVPASSTVSEALHAALAVRATADDARNTARVRIEALEHQRDGLESPAREAVERVLQLKAQADPEGAWITAHPDGDAPLSSETCEAVQQLVGAANTAATTTKRASEAAKADVKVAKELDERLQALAAWRAHLVGALEVLKKDNFPAWARDRRIAELVDTASELLSSMTGGRYRFDSHLRICDEVAGAVRSATTLSGGEKFEAALGLALGVAEIAGRSGIRFDTLFLDEGFAGLDQHNLDRALDALEAEVEQGRRVVLITHIGAVADRIKDVLYVEPDGMGGSTVRWLNEEERFELGADLDLTAAGGSE